jgi:membrane fusion protein (multidrug efflux system)
MHRGLESTDDAQTDGDVIAVPSLATGTILAIHFVDNQQVKAGDLLAELDPTPAKARMAQAEATLASAEASAAAADADVQVAETDAMGDKRITEAGLQTAAVGARTYGAQIKEADAEVRSAEASLAQAKLDHDRATTLFGSASISKAEFDKADTMFALAESNVDGARAHAASVRDSATQAKSRVVEASAKAKQSENVEPVVRQAQAKAQAAQATVETDRAARDLAAIDLSYTRILAPKDGVLSKRTINEGQIVAAGQSIVQLVTPHVWVTANFKETQLGKMRVGQPAHFTVDAYSGVELQGDVESISGATGAKFSLLPPDNATGNYTKIVQRVPVRIRVRDVPAGVVLRPGMSADATIDTR